MSIEKLATVTTLMACFSIMVYIILDACRMRIPLILLIIGWIFQISATIIQIQYLPNWGWYTKSIGVINVLVWGVIILNIYSNQKPTKQQ